MEAKLEEERTRREEAEVKLAEAKQTIANLEKQFMNIETEEEFISNKLIARLDTLKKEKEELAIQVEQEEEFLTNNLQRKLLELRKEKVELENELEQEEEFLTNRLQRQLDGVVRERDELREQLEQYESNDVESWCQQVAELKAQVKKLEEENATLRKKVAKEEAELFILGQKVSKEEEELREMKKQTTMLEADLEVRLERAFNEGGLQVPRAGRRARSVSANKASSEPQVGLSPDAPPTKRVNRSFSTNPRFVSPDMVPDTYSNSDSASPVLSGSPVTTRRGEAHLLSPRESYPSSSPVDSFMSNFAPDTSPLQGHKCLKQGMLRKFDPVQNSWLINKVVVYSSGTMLSCDNTSGVIIKIDLDRVQKIQNVSKVSKEEADQFCVDENCVPVNCCPENTMRIIELGESGKVCTSHLYQCEDGHEEFQDWFALLQDLSPGCT